MIVITHGGLISHRGDSFEHGNGPVPVGPLNVGEIDTIIKNRQRFEWKRSIKRVIYIRRTSKQFWEEAR